MNAAFPFNNRDHGAPSLHLLQILSINIHPNAEAVWDKEIAPLLTVLEGMKICAHTVIILCIYLYYTIYVLCCSYTNWHFCPSGVLMLGFFFWFFFLVKMIVTLSVILMHSIFHYAAARAFWLWFLVLTESAAESLDEKEWDKRLLEVCGFIFNIPSSNALVIFSWIKQKYRPTYLGREWMMVVIIIRLFI